MQDRDDPDALMRQADELRKLAAAEKHPGAKKTLDKLAANFEKLANRSAARKF